MLCARSTLAPLVPQGVERPVARLPVGKAGAVNAAEPDITVVVIVVCDPAGVRVAALETLLTQRLGQTDLTLFRRRHADARQRWNLPLPVLARYGKVSRHAFNSIARYRRSMRLGLEQVPRACAIMGSTTAWHV